MVENDPQYTSDPEFQALRLQLKTLTQQRLKVLGELYKKFPLGSEYAWSLNEVTGDPYRVWCGQPESTW